MSKQPIETTLYSLSEAPPHAPDRRSGERYLTLLRVGALQIGEKRELCLIRNVSAGGMMIRPYSPIEPGTPVSVELKHGDTVTGVAQWAEENLVGITFDEAIDVIALLTSSADGPAPRMPRIELSCTVTIRQDADVYRTRALNISQGGLCVQSEAQLATDGDVVVSIAGLQPAAGVVKWRDGELYGIGFNRVFPIGELMQFLQQQQGAGRRRATG